MPAPRGGMQGTSPPSTAASGESGRVGSALRWWGNEQTGPLGIQVRYRTARQQIAQVIPAAIVVFDFTEVQKMRIS